MKALFMAPYYSKEPTGFYARFHDLEKNRCSKEADITHFIREGCKWRFNFSNFL